MRSIRLIGSDDDGDANAGGDADAGDAGGVEMKRADDAEMRSAHSAESMGSHKEELPVEVLVEARLVRGAELAGLSHRHDI